MKFYVDIYLLSETIKHEIDRNKPLIDRLLADTSNLSADFLVDGLTRDEEEKYNSNRRRINGVDIKG